MSVALRALASLRPSWAFLASLAGLAMAMGTGGRLLRDPDTYWHLTAGRWIIENGTIPTEDPFAWSVPDAAWTAHEWLWEVMIHPLFQIGSWQAVGFATALTFAATLGVMMRFLTERMKPIRAIALIMLAALTLQPHVLARPHGFALLLLAIWTAGLLRAIETRRAPSLWLVLLMIPWSNAHASFVFGLALSAALALDAILTEPAPTRRWQLVRKWAIFGGLAGLASQINPIGIEAALYPLNALTMSGAGSLIGEWQPPVVARTPELEVWIIGLIAAAMLLRPRIGAVRVLLLLGLMHMALSHGRHADLLGIVAPLLLARSLDDASDRITGEHPPSKLDRWFASLARPMHPVSIALLTTSIVAGAWAAAPDRFMPVAANTPEAAVDAGLQLPGRVFNHYDYGGYLIFRGVPVFVDGRGDPYGNDFIERAVTAVTQGKNLLPLLDEYKADWTLLPNNSRGVEVLDGADGWLRYYSDDLTVVHRRVPLSPSGVTPNPDSASP